MKGKILCAARDAAELTICALCLVGSVQAVQQGATARGDPYLSGGVSKAEQVSLHAQRERFSLWVITAAKKSDAYSRMCGSTSPTRSSGSCSTHRWTVPG